MSAVSMNNMSYFPLVPGMPGGAGRSHMSDPLQKGRINENDPLQKGRADEDDAKQKGRIGRDPSEECQTCKNRKYQDGSNEMVSFKSAAHIAPQAAASVVRSHEQEHVSNAYAKAALENGRVIRASVTLKTEICPECGRSYVSGGTTNTQIKYYNEQNPYQQDLKAADAYKYRGMHVDAVA